MRNFQRRAPRQRPPRGAALLVAMVLLTVVATLAAGMVWQQWKGVQVEAAERSRVQTGWILHGALDWARLILREDLRSGRATSLNEPWATPLAEARLSTFLAADAGNNADSGPEAFLAGSITDAQSRYNLRNLLADNKVDERQLAILQRLCSGVGLGVGLATQIAQGLLLASQPPGPDNALPPEQLADLAWLGLDPSTLDRLASVAVLLPERSTVNLNTASREVLAAVIPKLGLGGADRLVQQRQRQPLRSLADATALLGQGIPLEPAEVDVRSGYFEVRGRLRLEHRVLNETTLVRRKDNEVVAVQRQRVATLANLAPR